MRKSYDSKFKRAFGTEGRAEEDVHGGRFDEENRTS